VPDLLARRRVLFASATTLPLLLAAAGCRSAAVFAGPDPLAGPPSPSPDVITLQAVIAAEANLIDLYHAAVGGDPRGTDTLLTQHEQHLAQLKARLVLPSATSPAAAPGRPPPGAAPVAPARVTVARLLGAERASAAGLVRQLAGVEPALAQLFASIAACHATHVAALGG
jgi:hypothetical protein